MRKLQALFKRLFKANSAEKEFLAYSREIQEANLKRNEVMFWIYDIGRYGPFSK